MVSIKYRGLHVCVAKVESEHFTYELTKFHQDKWQIKIGPEKLAEEKTEYLSIIVSNLFNYLLLILFEYLLMLSDFMITILSSSRHLISQES